MHIMQFQVHAWNSALAAGMQIHALLCPVDADGWLLPVLDVGCAKSCAGFRACSHGNINMCHCAGTIMVTFVDNESGGAAPDSVLGDFAVPALLCLLRQLHCGHPQVGTRV